MKVKFMWMGTICVMLLFGILCGVTLKRTFSSSTSDEFIQLINDGVEYELTEEQLEEYSYEIRKELASLKDRNSFEKIYFSLGKIASLEARYEQANNYLLNAVSFIGNTKIDVMIYETLAVNYIAMGEIEKGYFYFEEAHNYACKLKNPKQMISLYRSFSDALLNYTNHTSFPIYLLGVAIELTDDNYEQVQLRKRLASIYSFVGVSDLALNELIKALNTSLEYKYQDLTIDVYGQLGLFYSSSKRYQESTDALNRYFELAGDNADFDYVMVWLKNHYSLEDYESVKQEMKLLEEATASLSNEKKIRYEIFIHIAQAYFLSEEKRYEECVVYIEKLEELKQQYNLLPLTNLVINKIKLDVEYGQGNQGIDYVQAYRHLLSEVTAVNECVEMKNLIINTLLSRLLELGDYEALYQYTVALQQSVSQEMNGINVIINTIQMRDEFYYWSKNNIITMIWKLSGYVMATLVGFSLTYGAYRYNMYFKSLKQKAKDSVTIDSLTKTLTKKTLYEALELEMEVDQNEYYYFLLLDIDDLSSYNESFGYLAGDKVLIEISNLLKIYFPTAYISRHYGQSFIIVIKNVNEEELLQLITSLMNEISSSEKVSGKKTMTCCIGVSKGCLTNMLDIDEQIKLATKKLQISKQRGKGSYTM